MRTRSLGFLFLLAGMMVVSWAEHSFHPTPGQFKTFIGDKSGIWVYPEKRKSGNTDVSDIYFVAIDGSSFDPKKVCEGEYPKISPDGTRVLYVNSGALYVSSLVENSPASDKHKIAESTSSWYHYWWIHPTTNDEYIVYCKENSGIFCQKLDNDSKASGNPTKLFNNWAASGGRSGDGRFLAGTGLDIIDNTIYKGIFEITPSNAVANATKKNFVEFTGNIAGGVLGGYCYGYMSPANVSDPFYGCLVHLCGGHFAIHVRKFNASKTVDNTVVKTINAPNWTGTSFDTVAAPFNDGYRYNNWEMPVWSTHPEYITTYGGGKKKGGGTTIYSNHAFIINLTSGKYLRITNDEGDVFYSHLWVNTNTNNASPVKAVIKADKTRGVVPLNVTFDGSSSTGDNVSYSWNFGDSQTATGSNASHTYTQTGTYTARLIVKNTTIADTASLDIIVDAAPVVAAKVEITPSGPTKIIKNTSFQFSAKVFDKNDTELPDASVTWSVKGNGGGSITNDGKYTADSSVGKHDTIMAKSDQVTGQSIVIINDEAMQMLSSHNNATYSVGETVTIRYKTDPDLVDRISIGFSPDNGKTTLLISGLDKSIDFGDPNWGTFTWVIPDKITDAGHPDGASTRTTQGKFKIFDYANNYSPVVSKGTFAINNTNDAVNSPLVRSDMFHMRLVQSRNGYLLDIGGVDDYTVTIFNVKGVVYRVLTPVKDQPTELFQADFPPGCYIVRVHTQQRVYQQKILVSY